MRRVISALTTGRVIDLSNDRNITMIRKNALLCKIICLKNSSKSIFDAHRERLRPELETCPICGSTGNCHVHDYYSRSVIDFIGGRKEQDSIGVMRVFCESCQHAHAILPDVLVPYSRYSLFFILRVLGEYFAHLYSVEHLCERFGIRQNQLYKWIHLWKNHKQDWLGRLSDAETNCREFLKRLVYSERYSAFGSSFIRRFSCSFLQSHANPILKSPENARYCQTVFTPDISVT